ncbi:ribonucleases P/MRP protein subunit POP1 [Contarinia nasturtii]|uniref:ribonucleases P/MRP protein subunit POP1 n=1 Tax=Contarinia nasturtii TaxID=265458 RepID=UPI0012D3970B|nr:ribonucleases P/MRP protein subunit POP1 [Contarinia nasturtii]
MDGSELKKGNLPKIVEKFEYDAAVGGNTRVENEITTFNHCHQRINEIKSLTSAIANPNSTKLVFQKLPKHMRRRAMSHHPNRLPRKYRLAHRAQMSKSGAPAQTKRPSRKYRRKPSNILAAYQRRQRANIWLETHIWHAKRFHMVSKWGYKLAESSCDKTFRSSYRATMKHCLIQDISYVGNIEIRGPLDVLRNKFERMRGRTPDLGLCAKAYVGGQREGTIELFSIDAYPYGALGRFQFIWKRENDNDALRTLWLFAHPSVYQKLVDELCELFELELQDDLENGVKKHMNNTINAELYEMRHQLNRFRLTGPLSHAVLTAAFKPKITSTSEEKTWFVDYLMEEKNRKIHQTQTKHWNDLKHIKSAIDLPPGMILGLNIEDPRINRPKKRTKALPLIDSPMDDGADVCCTIPEFNGDSVLWERNKCERIQNEKVSTHEICVQRNKNILVPGERCAFENKLQAVPVLLIQRPGSKDPKNLGYGNGYDVIVPPGYGISTWMCLIMWGAKPGALREMETVAREALEDEFLPDTTSSIVNSNLMANELRKKYFRSPPNKRQNYLKLSIASPFKCPWMQLIQEWCNTSSPTEPKYYVLRDKNKLNKINQFLLGKERNLTDIDENCLIPVSLAMNGRGNAKKFSIICLPKKQDIRNNEKNRNEFINRPVLSEPVAIDVNETQRKLLRLNHLKMLKRLRRRRVRVKRKQQEFVDRKVIIAPSHTTKQTKLQYDRMCELWLPSAPKAIRKQCTRDVFGYLTQCQFMFHEAKVSGVGYVTVNGIRELAKLGVNQKRKLNQVLVRDPNSSIYRFATLSIRYH